MPSPAIPSRNTFKTGIPPATAASMPSVAPLPARRCQISGPCSASNSLFAVTTGLPPARAVSTICLATPVPPISSATTSTRGLSTTSLQSGVRSAFGCRLTASLGFVSTLREHTAETSNGKPSLPSISEALLRSRRRVPPPTLPSPMIPTRTADTEFHSTWACCHSDLSWPATDLILVFSPARLVKSHRRLRHLRRGRVLPCPFPRMRPQPLRADCCGLGWTTP